MSHKPVLTGNFAPTSGPIGASQYWSDTSSVALPPTIHAIKGEMFTTELILGESEEWARTSKMGVDSFEKDIKSSLCVALAKKLEETKMVSFTRQIDHYSGAIHYRARIYATPDETTRLVQGLLK